MENNDPQQRNLFVGRGTWAGEKRQSKFPQENQHVASKKEAFKNVAQESDASGAKIKSFKELIVWQKGFELVKEIYAATATFPREELYGLVSQLRRSAVSVPSNIAEGFRRRFQKELKQFLNIAIGSLAEIETQLAIAGELGYLNPQSQNRLVDLTDQVIRLAIGLSKKI